jgi:acetoin utilization deacetylase AcuC-like enzyme
MFESIHRILSNLRGNKPLRIWYHPRYRLPLPSLGPRLGIEPRRADLVAWFLERSGASEGLREPIEVAYADLVRVHDAEYLSELTTPDGLAAALGMVQSEAPVEEVLRTYRLACGGTLAATRHALRTRSAALNLLGGFHRAGRAAATGLSLVNDIGVAIGALRASGFQGRIGLLDLDAHPPDLGALEALQPLWVGTLCASEAPARDARGHGAGGAGSSDAIEEVWEVLSPGAGDEPYLQALRHLLGELPEDLDLCYVVAGGDVLGADRLGSLSLSLEGVRRRDREVHATLGERAAVWLPGGGFGHLAWRVLAGTALELSGAESAVIPADADPLAAHLRQIGDGLSPSELRGADSGAIGALEIAADLHLTPPVPRLLGYYTAEGLELALHRYGFLEGIERLGYDHPRVAIDSSPPGDRMRVFGYAGEQEYLLVEVVLEIMEINSAPLLFIHWLTLMHPLAAEGYRRPLLPGQEQPGLGLAREASELLRQMARRLGLRGVAFRPAWYHTAYAARHRMYFLDPARQARFEALIKAARGRPLGEVTAAVAAGEVLLGGEPYTWEADVMVDELQPLRRGSNSAITEGEKGQDGSASPPRPLFTFLDHRLFDEPVA